MQQQSIATGVSTRAVMHTLKDGADEKCVFSDLMVTAGEVAAALGACWLLNLVA